MQVLRWTALIFLTTCLGSEASMPVGRAVAVRGQPAILGCEFTPDSTSSLSPLVVTWQRVEDSRVVHSFYYQQDQLKLQSQHYRNRTSLFRSELLKGNASLRIEPVGPGDQGEYLCTVSNTKGTDKTQVRLEYGAFYTEPTLSINVSCSSVTLLYETEGFPKPEVRWYGADGDVLGNHTELSEAAHGADGAVELYHLKSRHVSSSSSVTVIFTLKNQLLNQDLLRPVSITYVGEDGRCGGNASVFMIILSVLCVLLSVCIVLLLIRMKRTAWRRSPVLTNSCARTENGHEKGPSL